MPLFDYRAKDNTGKDVAGVVEAPSESLALGVLEERQLTPLYIQARAEGGVWQASLKFFNRVTAKDLVIFSRQLAVMSSATVPLLESLRILIKQTENDILRMIISDVGDEVEGGAKLSTALGKYPDTFSDFYINMIKSGETSGRLDESLNYLADEAEKNHELSSKIRGAMIYPAFIIGGLFIVGFVMMVFVLPKLTTILQDSKTKLPFSTELLIATSNFMQHQWWLLIILILALVVAIRLAVRNPTGRLIWHRLQLRLPIFGQIYRKIYIVRFTRSLGTLLQGGVPLTRSLEVVAGVVGNAVFKDLINQTIHQVEEGNSVSTVFLESSIMPAMVSQMMVVGEKTGRLEEILQRLSNFYSKEVETLVTNLVTLVEPLIMIVLGLAVGVMVSAIILPLYNLAGSF
ncbi:MAG: type II secretion system F family protein [Candidatus Kerfeldbacteria bacterium]|nr:type II secretion system F family protein [Candidatus Kerfeldbacteria bacterium]